MPQTTKRNKVQQAPHSGPSSLPTSSIIPLPKTHIHRTPSELQLADETRRAEYDDVRMYARLVVGMQSQIQRDYHSNGGVIHPLSKKSLAGVVKTKQANDDELGKKVEEEEGGWEMTHIEEEVLLDSTETSSSVTSPWSVAAQRPLGSKSSSDNSLSTRGSMKLGLVEDDAIFSLEL